MDATILAVFCVSVLAVLVLYRVGYKRMENHKTTILRITDHLAREYNATVLGMVSYQGGLPEMQRIVNVYFGLAPDCMIFYDERGSLGRVFFHDCIKIEQFAVLQKASGIGKSTALLGPLVPYFFKDRTRNFITIKYIDVDQEENNLLLEVPDKKMQQEFYKAIYFCVRKKNLSAQSKGDKCSEYHRAIG
ncbi:MAG: hypothetical protein H6Q72_3101 [Firmicutes bacterium]|nr:hypothetical protein [Bacillota bacterium]